MAGARFEHPYYPIIYVRGYAGTDSDIEDTVSDPYMGFNLGSTRIRTLWTGDTERYYFESPLVRLPAHPDTRMSKAKAKPIDRIWFFPRL